MANIEASANYIKNVGNLARRANTPDIHRADRRPVSDAPPKDVATISPGAIKPQPLEFNPELPTFDDSQSPIQQLGGNDETVFFLALGLKDVQAAAKGVRQENQVLGGTASA